MSSRICRSSSVSPPSSRRSMCLPSSSPRSRASRGSLLQALPIGCMRVRMTLSCSSAVIWSSRCSGAWSVVPVSWRTAWSSWFRVSTSSPTRFISCSRRSSLTRSVWAETVSTFPSVSEPCSAAGVGAGRVSSAIGGAAVVARGVPHAARSSRAISSSSSPCGSDWWAARWSRIERTRSTAAKIAPSTSGVGSNVPSRRRPSTFSAACATRSRRVRARKPQVPLIVWTMRKMLAMRSRSSGSRSRLTSSASRVAIPSQHSVRNSDRSSSIAPYHPAAGRPCGPSARPGQSATRALIFA